MTASLTANGLVVPTALEIKTELETAFRSAFGQSIDLHASSPFGQLVGILASREADLWEIVSAIKDARNPESATALMLDEICSITGTYRDGAAKSAVTVTLLGDDTTEIPISSLVSTVSTGSQFSLDTAATLAAPDAWAASTSYVVNDTVASDGKVYRVLTAGTSGATTLSGVTTNVADGSIIWRNVGEGAAYADVTAKAVDYGPVVGLADDITVIDSPVTGWDSVVNLDDAIVGYFQESDASLRTKRDIELYNRLGPTSGGFVEYLSTVDGVTQVYVFENNSSETDANGVPSNSFESLVVGGTDADVADAVFAIKPLGVQAYGNTEVTVYDTQGSPQTIGFSRPTEVNVFININLVVEANIFPENGDNLVRDAVLALEDTLVPGKDIVSSKIKALCHSVVGVLDVSSAYIGLSSSANTEVTVPISIKQIAVLSSNRITVSSTTGTP